MTASNPGKLGNWPPVETGEGPGLRVAVLIACFNRKSSTVNALGALLEQASEVPGLEVSVYLVDDGTDGTWEAVRESYPQVHISRGTGDLFWAGGMGAAFEASMREGMFEAYWLLNDDVRLWPNSVGRFVAEYIALNNRADAILVGATCDPETGLLTYSGMNVNSRWRLFTFKTVTPDPETAVPCDTFNANCVLVPGKYYWFYRGLDKRYKHGLADLDLGLDARRKGLGSFVATTYVGSCARGPSTEEMLARRRFGSRAWAVLIHPYALQCELWFAWKHRPRLLLPLYAFRGVRWRWKMLGPKCQLRWTGRN